MLKDMNGKIGGMILGVGIKGRTMVVVVTCTKWEEGEMVEGMVIGEHGMAITEGGKTCHGLRPLLMVIMSIM